MLNGLSYLHFQSILVNGSCRHGCVRHTAFRHPGVGTFKGPSPSPVTECFGCSDFPLKLFLVVVIVLLFVCPSGLTLDARSSTITRWLVLISCRLLYKSPLPHLHDFETNRQSASHSTFFTLLRLLLSPIQYEGRSSSLPNLGRPLAACSSCSSQGLGECALTLVHDFIQG